MKLYDVCNDYSLELTEEIPVKGSVKWFDRTIFVAGESVDVKLGYCSKHNELIYLKTDSELDLSGKHL